MIEECLSRSRPSYLVTVDPHLHPLTQSHNLVSARQVSARIATNLENIRSDLLRLLLDALPRLPRQLVHEGLGAGPLYHSVGTGLRLILRLKRLYGGAGTGHSGDRVISSIKYFL